MPQLGDLGPEGLAAYFQSQGHYRDYQRQVAANLGWMRRQTRLSRAQARVAFGIEVGSPVPPPNTLEWLHQQRRQVKGAAEVLANKPSPFRKGRINVERVFAPHEEIAQLAEAQGLYGATTKMEDAMAGMYQSLGPHEVSPGGHFYRGGKMALYQRAVHPSFTHASVAAWETGIFGRVLPRVVTPRMAEMRMGPHGQAYQQELMARAALVSPRQKWSRTLAQGRLESEIALVSPLFEGTQYAAHGTTETRAFGYARPMLVYGQKKFAGGRLPTGWSRRHGVDLIFSADMLKDPQAVLDAMLQDVMSESARRGRNQLRRTQTALRQAGLDIDFENSLAVLRGGSDALKEAGLSYTQKRVGGMQQRAAARYAVMSEHEQAFRGAFGLLRQVARAQGLPLPFSHMDIPGVGPARRLTLPVHARVSASDFKEWAQRSKKFPVDIHSLMGMSEIGPVNALIAEGLENLAVEQQGTRIAAEFAPFTLATGHRLRPDVSASFRQLSAWDVPMATVNRLRVGFDTPEAARAFLAQSGLPDQPYMLTVPEAVSLPTMEALEAKNVRRYGVRTRHIPLPDIRRAMQASIGAQADSLEFFVNPVIRSTAELMHTAGLWAQARKAGPAKQAIAEEMAARFQMQLEGHYDLLASQTGKDRHWSHVFKPGVAVGATVRGRRMGGAVNFGQIMPGHDPKALGIPGLQAAPLLDFNEVAMSEAAALKAGFSRSEIAAIRRGGEAYGYTQAYPQIHGGTTQAVRLRHILPDRKLGPNTLVVNTANALMGERDYDWDPMLFSRMPEEVPLEVQQEAFRESRARTAAWWKTVPANRVPEVARSAEFSKVFTRGPYAGWTKEDLRKAIKQKALPGLYWEPTQAMRELALKQAGPGQSWEASLAIGKSYQEVGIKKGMTASAELYDALAGVTGGNFRREVRQVEKILGSVATPDSDIIMGLDKKGRRRAAMQLVSAAAEQNALDFSQKTQGTRLISGEAPLGLGKALEVAAEAQGAERTRSSFMSRLMGMGSQVQATGRRLQNLSQAAANQATKEAAAAGHAMGGLFGKVERFWNKMPGPAKWAAAGLLGIGAVRLARTSLFGDDEGQVGPAMNVSPDLMARIGANQFEGMGSAPMPPEPMVEPGIHGHTIAPAEVPFSPPPARVTSPLGGNPQLRVQATDVYGTSTRGLAGHMMASLGSPSGIPSAHVIAPEYTGKSDRIERMVAQQHRAENRLYHA